MFPYTSDFLKTAENPLICSRKRKVQKIRPRHQSKRLVPRRNLGLDVKDREIGVFKTLINKGVYIKLKVPHIIIEKYPTLKYTSTCY